MSFCVMDEAMDQHRGTGDAQVLYNGLANKLCVLTRDPAELPLAYRSLSSRIVDERKAVTNIHGAWEDDSYDETSYAYNT